MHNPTHSALRRGPLSRAVSKITDVLPLPKPITAVLIFLGAMASLEGYHVVHAEAAVRTVPARTAHRAAPHHAPSDPLHAPPEPEHEPEEPEPPKPHWEEIRFRATGRRDDGAHHEPVDTGTSLSAIRRVLGGHATIGEHGWGRGADVATDAGHHAPPPKMPTDFGLAPTFFGRSI
jgi:hypothetical protein